MLEISGGPVDCSVPDHLTIPQFFLDSHHPLRPARKAGIPWLIEDATGRAIDFEEVRGKSVRHTSISKKKYQLRTRTFGLANALKARYRIGACASLLTLFCNLMLWGNVPRRGE